VGSTICRWHSLTRSFSYQCADVTFTASAPANNTGCTAENTLTSSDITTASAAEASQSANAGPSSSSSSPPAASQTGQSSGAGSLGVVSAVALGSLFAGMVTLVVQVVQ
jgi:hypothetical protein